MNEPSEQVPTPAWSDLPALLALAALLAVVFLQFVTRYLLNDSLGWTEEIARYLLIIACYGGSATAVRRGGHVFLEVVYRLSPSGNTRPMAVFAELLNLAYYAGLTVLVAALALHSDQRMVSIAVPKSLVYAVVGIALAISSVHAVTRVRRRLRQSDREILDEFDNSDGGKEAT